MGEALELACHASLGPLPLTCPFVLPSFGSTLVPTSPLSVATLPKSPSKLWTWIHPFKPIRSQRSLASNKCRVTPTRRSSSLTAKRNLPPERALRYPSHSECTHYTHPNHLLVYAQRIRATSAAYLAAIRTDLLFWHLAVSKLRTKPDSCGKRQKRGQAIDVCCRGRSGPWRPPRSRSTCQTLSSWKLGASFLTYALT